MGGLSVRRQLEPLVVLSGDSRQNSFENKTTETSAEEERQSDQEKNGSNEGPRDNVLERGKMLQRKFSVCEQITFSEDTLRDSYSATSFSDTLLNGNYASTSSTIDASSNSHQKCTGNSSKISKREDSTKENDMGKKNSPKNVQSEKDFEKGDTSSYSQDVHENTSVSRSIEDTNEETNFSAKKEKNSNFVGDSTFTGNTEESSNFYDEK